MKTLTLSNILMIIFLLLFAFYPVVPFAQEGLNEQEQTTIEEVEAELENQDLKEETTKKAIKLENNISERSSAPVPMMATMDAGDPPDLEEAIFTTNSHMTAPDISMKIGSFIANFPITVPPGRNSLTPKVYLHYNSSAKNGIVGVGWNLNIDSIKRSTKRAVCYTCTDFTYNGEKISPVSVDADGYGTYRPEKEQAFSILEFHSDNSWTVTLKSGIKHTYGSDVSSRQDNINGTFQWFLKAIEDTNGNTITYSYTNGQGQVYLSTIEYVDFYTIFFYYEQRPDTILSYVSHAAVTIAKRLKTISVDTINEPVRAYDLSYETSANTTQSILTQITLYGSDVQLNTDNVVYSGTSLPPVQASYNQGLSTFILSPSEIQNNLSKGQGFSNTQDYPIITGDWNGDGAKDIGRAGDNNIQLYISTGDNFEHFFTLSDLSKGQGYNYSDQCPFLTGDWNGDGRTDIGRTKDNTIKFYISIDTGFETYHTLSGFGWQPGMTQDRYPIFTGDWNGDAKTDIGVIHNHSVSFYTSDESGWQAYNGLSTFGVLQGYHSANSHPILTGDYNGDGKTDIARVGDSAIEVFVSTGSGFSAYQNLPVPGLSYGYSSYDFCPTFTGDFNGDGLTDIGRAGDDHVTTHLSNGNGFISGPQITNDLTKNHGCDDSRAYPIFTGDFNDDGLADIGRVKSDKVVVYVSTGNNFIRYGSDINNLSPAHGFNDPSEYPLLTGDFNGDGKTCICRISDSGVVFFSPDGRASDLMSQLTSSAGNTTQIKYKPSSRYNNKSLPFILHTVSEIHTNDGLDNTAMVSYRYAGGLYDLFDKELRSFEFEEKINPDGTKETTQFHQDKFLDHKPIQTEHSASDNTLLSKTEYTWESDPYDNNTAFIKLLSKKKIMFENGDETILQEDFAYYDTHGNLHTYTVSGTGLPENKVTVYEYDYYGTGGTYPLRTIKKTLSGSMSGMLRQNLYSYETVTGNLLSETAVNTTGDNPVTQYGYDFYGNIISVTDPRGNVTTYEYDSQIKTYLIKETRPVTGDALTSFNHVTQYSSVDYRYGKPLSFENENAFLTSYTYDAFGRVTQIDYPDSGQETYAYDETSMPRSITKGIKNSDTSFIYAYTYIDGLGRTIQTSSKSKDNYVITLFTFDNMGREKCVKGPFFQSSAEFSSADFTALSSDPSTVEDNVVTTWARNYYDARSRIFRIQQSGGINTYFAYNNLETTVTDPDGCQKTQVADALNKIVKIIEHGITDHSTDYIYNIADDLLMVSRINPDTGNPIENTVTYNTLGQKTAMTDPDMGTWSYSYDFNGNLVSQTDANNVTLTFTYDVLNRQIRKTYPDGNTANFEYDAGTNSIGFLFRKSNANAVEQFDQYDEMGRTLSKTETIDNTAVKHEYTYDPAGREKTKNISRDNTVFKTLAFYFYPGTSLLQSVKNGNNEAYTEITQYTPQGKIEFMNHSNNTVTNYIYDYATSRISIIHSYNINQDIVDKSYAYTKAGDVKEIANGETGITYTYEYDHLHRLISEKSSRENAVNGTQIEIIELNYTEAGNAPVHAPSQTRKNGTLSEYIYTTTGNRLAINEPLDVVAYESNADNMITKITKNGMEIRFFYNADNRRVKKTQGITSTYYFGKNFEIINNTSTMYVFAGNLRVAKITDADLVYFHKDHLGSTNALSRADGTVIDLGEYFPYGLDKENNVFLQISVYKYTDQEYEDSTGLYNYDARFYDPDLGLFVMADTIVPELFNAQSFNRYAYCYNNPLLFSDPSGHLVWGPGVVGAILAGGANAIKNYNTLSGRKYWEAIAVGAASGFISAYTGILGGATAAALNEIHDQTLKGRDITNYDTSQIIATIGVAGTAGSITKSLTDFGKGFARYSDDLFAPLSDWSCFGVVGEIAGTYSDLVYSPETSDWLDGITGRSDDSSFSYNIDLNLGVDTYWIDQLDLDIYQPDLSYFNDSIIDELLH